MADKVYLTPTPGSTGHRGGVEVDPVHLQLKELDCCHSKKIWRTVSNRGLVFNSDILPFCFKESCK